MPRTVEAGRGLRAVSAPAVARDRPRNTAAEAYFDAIGGSDTTLLLQLVALVDAWQACGAWDEIDMAQPVLELVSGQTTFPCLKNPGLYVATVAAGSPTISSQGVQDATSSSQLDTGWNPATDATNYTLGVAEFGVYVNTDEMPVNYFGIEMGHTNAFIRAMQTTTTTADPSTANGRTNRNQSFSSDTGVGSALGLTSFVRTAATGANINFIYRDGVSITATGRGGDAVAITNSNMYLLNWNGSSDLRSPRRVSFCYAGGILSDRPAFVSAMKRFLRSRGAA